MFEKVSQVAEEMATRVSRRRFLGRVGGAALIAAAAVGGILAFPGNTVANQKCSSDSDCSPGQVCFFGHCALVCTGGDPLCFGATVGSRCDTPYASGRCTNYRKSTICYCG